MTASASVFTRATLHAGEMSTEYLRAGHGGAVLLLISAGGESALSLELIGALARRCRVIAPLSIRSDAAFVATLESFVEGLGITTSAVVAEGSFCTPALEYVAERSSFVSRLALLVPSDEGRHGAGESAAAALRAAAAQRLGDYGAALFVRGVGRHAGPPELEQLAEELLRFLV